MDGPKNVDNNDKRAQHKLPEGYEVGSSNKSLSNGKLEEDTPHINSFNQQFRTRQKMSDSNNNDDENYENDTYSNNEYDEDNEDNEDNEKTSSDDNDNIRGEPKRKEGFLKNPLKGVNGVKELLVEIIKSKQHLFLLIVAGLLLVVLIFVLANTIASYAEALVSKMGILDPIDGFMTDSSLKNSDEEKEFKFMSDYSKTKSFLKVPLSLQDDIYDQFVEASSKNQSYATDMNLKLKNGRINTSIKVLSGAVDANDEATLFTHMINTEKYNFNYINWQEYVHSKSGPQKPDMTVNKKLGIQFPKQAESNYGSLVSLVQPYLQTWLIPMSIYSGTFDPGNETESSKNVDLAYQIISNAYSDITVNKYDLESLEKTYERDEYTETTITYDKNGKEMSRASKNVSGSDRQTGSKTITNTVYKILKADTFDVRWSWNITYTKYDENGAPKSTVQSTEAIDEESPISNKEDFSTKIIKKGTKHITKKYWRDEVNSSGQPNISLYTSIPSLSSTGSTLGTAGAGSSSVSAEVLAWKDTVIQHAQTYGMTAYVDLLLAVMQQESGGTAADIMQTAESAYNKSGGPVTDPEVSIDYGVQELKTALEKANCQGPGDLEGISLALQAYNFGTGFIDYVQSNGGKYTLELAQAFSNAHNSGSGYGDIHYVDHVLQYYNITANSNSSSSSGSGKSSSSGSSTNSTSSALQNVVQIANQKLGCPYVWGAAGPDSFDCSGLVYFCYYNSGFNIERTTAQAYYDMSDLTNNPQPGDLVFFGIPSNIHHIAIYISPGKIIEAPRTGDVVKINDISNHSDFAGYGKYTGSIGNHSVSVGLVSLSEDANNYYQELADLKELDRIMIINANETINSKYVSDDEKWDKNVGVTKNKLLIGYDLLRDEMLQMTEDLGHPPFAYGTTLGIEIDANSLSSSNSGSGMFAWPVDVEGNDGARIINCTFGTPANHDGYHGGIDISPGSVRGTTNGLSSGPNILASTSGTVTTADSGYGDGHIGSDDGGGFGNHIYITDSTGSYVTIYAHLSEILVTEGQEVKKGDVIGKMGTSGNSSGVHLHFEIKKDGNREDPLNYFVTDPPYGDVPQTQTTLPSGYKYVSPKGASFGDIDTSAKTRPSGYTAIDDAVNSMSDAELVARTIASEQQPGTEYESQVLVGITILNRAKQKGSVQDVLTEKYQSNGTHYMYNVVYEPSLSWYDAFWKEIPQASIEAAQAAYDAFNNGTYVVNGVECIDAYYFKSEKNLSGDFEGHTLKVKFYNQGEDNWTGYY